MSLFPAYNNSEAGPSGTSATLDTEQRKNKDWLTNTSFISLEINNANVDEENSIAEVVNDISSSDESSKYRKRKKKEKIKRPKIQNEFTGDEEYYVDKKSCKSYLSVKTLHKPACPRYNRFNITIGRTIFETKENMGRYFAKRNIIEDEIPLYVQERPIMDEGKFCEKTKELNNTLRHNPKSLPHWIELIKLQNLAPIKVTKTQLAEKKIEIIERALTQNYSNDDIYQLYIDVLNDTYPSFEVSKILEKLISKDHSSYILWNAQILASQGSMARCIVPDVLRLYEECMQKMYRKSQKDEIMIKLFTSCALFLRQAGLNEQFFALIKLALELNVSVDKFNSIQPSPNDQKMLIEFEEIILKSGLPMNEIWLRIEKLRQNFNFLPCAPESDCSDPQRIIFNEDICYFIFPMAEKENIFQLVLTIFSLIKIPFICTASLRNQFLFKHETHNEFDAIEDILGILNYRTTECHHQQLMSFDQHFAETVTEMASSPSFLSKLGSENYIRTLTDILLLCSECFEHEERKRQVIILIWLRFERILVIIGKYLKKWRTENSTQLKSKIKYFFKRDNNRNVLNFYVEYALIEYELGNFTLAENILVKTITDGDSQTPNSDFCHAYVSYAEILLREKQYSKALHVLTCYALNSSLNDLDDEPLTEPKKLSAVKKITYRFNDLFLIEKNVQIMELDQHFLPDYFTCLLKAKIYLQILLNEKLEAMTYLEKILKHFVENNPRHQFIRENTYEIYLKILRFPSRSCFVSNLLTFEIASRAFKEFPKNLYITRCIASLDCQAWYNVRRLLTTKISPVSIIFLVIAARHRFSKNNLEHFEFQFLSSNIDASEEAYKRRIGNILKLCVSKNSQLRKNSLIWRFYMQNLCDLRESFDNVKNALFSALDECPWNKAIYLDGAILVPQEVAQLQDLLLEKQLRMYALPEELEILRSNEA